MPDIGNTAGAGTSTRALNSAARGIPITMPEDGTTVSISAKITIGDGDTIYAAIYDSSDNLVAEEVAGVTPGAVTASYATVALGGAALSNGQTYRIFMQSDTGGNVIYHTPTADAGRFIGGLTPGTWPDPATISTDGRDYDVYLTYSTGAPSGNPWYYYANQA